MSVIIPLEPIANQSLSIQLDNHRYAIRLRDIGYMMSLDIDIDDVVTLVGSRAIGGLPLIPYKYLENGGGNFAFITELGDLPHFEKFGATQFLIYFTADELGAIRAT